MYVAVGGPPDDWKCYKVLDANTNREIRNVVWANDETGTYEIIVKHPTTGQPFVHPTTGNPMRAKKKGNIKIVRNTKVNSTPIAETVR